MTEDVNGSHATGCSIAPDVPSIPEDAVEFAKAVGQLAEQYNLSRVSMKIEVDTGYGSKYRNRGGIKGETVVETMGITVSRKDGRGRPRTQIVINAEMSVSLPIVWEQDTSN